PKQLCFELCLHCIVVNGSEPPGIHLTGVVDEDVHAAELFLCGIDHFRNVGLLGHVSDDGMNLTAGSLGQLISSLFEPFLIASRDQHSHAFFQKLTRSLKSNAAAAAGDNRAAAFDSQIHPYSPVDACKLTIEYPSHANARRNRGLRCILVSAAKSQSLPVLPAASERQWRRRYCKKVARL